MAGEEDALTVERAKARLLEESPSPVGLAEAGELIRRYPLASMAIAAVAGVVLVRSGVARALLAPTTVALIKKMIV